MQRYYSKWFVFRFSLIAFAISLAFIIVVLFVQAQILGLVFTASGISELHKRFPVFFIIDFLPIIVAIIAYYISKYISFVQNESKEFTEKETSRQRKLYRFVQKLKEGDISA